jgi:hypothetical protein
VERKEEEEKKERKEIGREKDTFYIQNNAKRVTLWGWEYF